MLRYIWGFFFGKKPVEFISANRLEKIYMNPKYVVVDTRPMGEYLDKYIIGSVNIPQTSFYRQSRKKVHPSQHVVLVCRNGHVATNAYHTLKKRQFRWVRVLKDGINDLENTKQYLLVEKNKVPKQITEDKNKKA